MLTLRAGIVVFIPVLVFLAVVTIRDRWRTRQTEKSLMKLLPRPCLWHDDGRLDKE